MAAVESTHRSAMRLALTALQEALVDGLDLPDENFDYSDFVEREFGTNNPVPRGFHWFWWLIALLVLGALILLWIRH